MDILVSDTAQLFIIYYTWFVIAAQWVLTDLGFAARICMLNAHYRDITCVLSEYLF